MPSNKKKNDSIDQVPLPMMSVGNNRIDLNLFSRSVVQLLISSGKMSKLIFILDRWELDNMEATSYVNFQESSGFFPASFLFRLCVGSILRVSKASRSVLYWRAVNKEININDHGWLVDVAILLFITMLSHNMAMYENKQLLPPTRSSDVFI